MSIIQVIFLICIWALPIFLIINFYVKIDKEKQQEFKNEMKSPSVLIVGGLNCIGLLVFQSGNITTIKSLQHIGATMVFFGWIYGSIAVWNKSVKKSVLLILLGVLGVFIYWFLVM